MSFDLKTYLKETEKVVNIDSGTQDAEGVTKVGEYFSEKFRTLGGWTIRKAAEATTVAPCLEIFNKDDKHFDILLLCHIDTVFPKGTVAKRPFSCDEKRAYGPGTYDMKAPTLSVYYALKQLQEEGKLDNLSICLGLNSEEEIGSRNARAWIESVAKRSSYALVCEPARKNGEMVIARKGLGRFVVNVFGKSAHAGISPQDGINAILILSKWVQEIQALTDYAKGTTLNVGLIRGGTGVNTVPDQAACEIDVRLEDPSEFDRIEAKFKELAAMTEKAGGRSEVTGGLTRPVMPASQQSKALADIVDVIAERLGVKFEWMKTGGGSDANFCGALGLPTLDGFGPVGGLSHTDNEYIELDTVEPRLNLLRDTIAKIGEMKKNNISL